MRLALVTFVVTPELNQGRNADFEAFDHGPTTNLVLSQGFSKLRCFCLCAAVL